MCGGAQIRFLENVCRQWPISVHGLASALAVARMISMAGISTFMALVDRIDPFMVSGTCRLVRRARSSI